MTFIAVILGIVLVIILLIIGLLFVPLTYEVRFSSRKPYMVDAHALLGFKKVFYAHFRYEQGQPFEKEVIALGKAKLGPARDYEEWLAKRVAEETNEDMDNIISPIEQDSVAVKPNSNIEDLNLTQESSDSPDEPKEDVSKASDKERVQANNKKPDSKWWLPHVKNLELYKAIMRFVRRVYDHSKPRAFYIEGLFGTGDPFETGILAGLFYAFCPERMEDVEFNFIEPAYGCSGYLKGKIVPAKLVWYGLCLVTTKPVRALIFAKLKYDKSVKLS